MKRILALGALLVPFAAVPAGAAPALPTVLPQAETRAMLDDEAGGNANADDPALWVHPSQSGRSLVLGTAKEGGLDVYRLDGSLVQHFAAPPAPGEDDENGRFNNVDVVYGLGGRDVAVVTDRGRDTLRFYAIDPGRPGEPLSDVTGEDVPFLFNATQEEVNEQRTPYGLTTWKDKGRTYALVSRRSTTTVALVEIVKSGRGLSYRLVRQIALPKEFPIPGGTWTPCGDPGDDPQVEGMVVDQERDVLYAAQEDVGIWRIPADLKGEPRLIERVREFGTPAAYDADEDECLPTGPNPGTGGTHLTADAEGLTIYETRDGGGYLLASSQGDSTFAVYSRTSPGAYLGGFTVGGPDGAQHSDGAAVVNVPLGRAFPTGLLVVHDGENTPVRLDDEGEVRENTNFKFVRWDAVANPLHLRIDLGGDPRR
ncbi:phytase [Actinocorallia aurea]